MQLLTDEQIKDIGIAVARLEIDDEDAIAFIFARAIEAAVIECLCSEE